MSAFAPKSLAEAKEHAARRKAKKTAKPPKKKTKPKKKRVKLSTLKRKAWVQFSIFIRTRGADSSGFNSCITCGTRKFWRDLQAGHFIRGRLNANLFEERGCHAQCYSCNVGAQGAVVFYYKKMLEMFSQEVIDELIAQNNQTHKWEPGELQAIIDKYSTLNAMNPLVDH